MPNDTDLPQNEATKPQGENRKTGRARINWRAKVSVQGIPVDARAVDLTGTGIGLELRAPVPAKAVIHLALQVPSLKPGGKPSVFIGQVRVEYQVLRGEFFRTGASWTQLPAEQQEILVQWHERLLRAQS